MLDNRKLVYVLAGLLVIAVAAFGWSLTRGYEKKKDEVEAKALIKAEPEATEICGSSATYARLKEVAFEEAIRLGAADPANLDTLAANSIVRMEQPVVLNRDDNLNITVCAGRLFLEFPPGAETAFGGERRLTARIEYAAQEAADGSGLVYEIRGGAPIIQKLAAFNLRGRPLPTPAAPAGQDQFAEAVPLPMPTPATAPQPQPAPVRVPPQAEAQAPAPKPASRPAAKPAPATERSAAASRPSFSCRSGQSRSEQMVCASGRLAALDRAMSSQFYSSMAGADRRTRAELRRTREYFLAYRERCRNEACVADAYEGRMREIRDIMADR